MNEDFERSKAESWPELTERNHIGDKKLKTQRYRSNIKVKKRRNTERNDEES